ncbi:uncharacterized protein LOC113294955 [Papaver somniferum]|uniref:uncharacterized protein LOC113294955 n=1 Tax=Papaver somniferum TaxID=3469 RepID=UPI000E7015C9|nr:uncharacterized protein LOC113294955 [Papaver somniferum]
MGKVLGTPIVVDQKTLYLDFGYFAAVLVDIDFGKNIPERIRIKSGGKSFWQYLDIPKSPKFCLHCNIIVHHEKECKKKPADKTVHNNEPAQNNSTSSQDWKEIQRRRKSRKGKNSGTSQGFHGGNVGSVEKTSQLEDEVSRSEDEFNAAAPKLERAKKAAADNLTLVNRTELERTSALVTMSDGSQALINSVASASTSNTAANENDVNIVASQEHIIEQLNSSSVYQALTKKEVIISPNKLNVLSDELSFNTSANDMEDSIGESSSDESINAEQVIAGVKGTQWGGIPMDKPKPKTSRRARRVAVNNNAKKDKPVDKSSSELEWETNDLGIKVKKGVSPVITRISKTSKKSVSTSQLANSPSSGF